MQLPRQPHPVGKPTDARPAWLWRGARPPLGRDALRRDLAQAIQRKAAIHLYGPAGRGKSTLAAHAVLDHAATGGRALWLEAGDAPLDAILCRIARAYRDDPRAQAALKSGRPSEHGGASPPLASLARCLRERQPILVLADAPDFSTIAPLIAEITGALPILSFGERTMGADWPGEERALPPLPAEAAMATLRRAAGGGEYLYLSPITTALAGEALALVICGGAIRAGDWTMPAAAAALKSDSAPPTERVLRAIFPRLAPAAQGALLLLAFGPRAGQSFASLQQSSGAPKAELAALIGELRRRALVREWAQGERIALPPAIREFARELALHAGTAVELRARAWETWRERLRSALAGGADAWAQLPELLVADEWEEAGSSAEWRELAPLWEAAATELEARGYAYELRELRQRAGTTEPKAALPAPLQLWANAPSAVVADDESESDDILTADEDESEVTFETDSAFLAADELLDDALPLFAADDAGEPDDILTADEDESEVAFVGDSALPAADDLLDDAPPAVAADDGSEPDDNLTADEDESEVAFETDSAFVAEEALPDVLTPVSLPAAESPPAAQLTQFHRTGAAQLERGDIAAAIASLSTALSLAERLADDATRAEIQYLLGCAQLEDGALEAAQSTLEGAHAAYESCGDARGAANALGALGSALGEQGRWSAAAEVHRSAVAATRIADDRAEEALQLSALAYAYRRSEQLSAAVRSYRQALYLAYEAVDSNGIAQAAADLAEVLMGSPRHLSIAALLLNEAIAAGAPDSDATELRAELTRALAEAKAAGVTQSPVRGDAYAYARQAYEPPTARQQPA